MRRTLFLIAALVAAFASPLWADDGRAMDARAVDTSSERAVYTAAAPTSALRGRPSGGLSFNSKWALPHWAVSDQARAADGAVTPDDERDTVHEVMDEDAAQEQGDTGAEGSAGSNPLSGAKVLDLIWDYRKATNRKHINDFYAKGSTMLLPRLKLSIELHYWDTNVTGESERDWEQISIKPIYFVQDLELGDTWGLRLAAGFEYIYDFANADKGIGTGADLFAPLVGFAFANKETKTVLIPLVQHFEDVQSGADVRQTAFRVIALQPFPDGFWGKLDLKVPRDWENDEWPASAELEFGKMIAPHMGVFVQGLAGMGGDEPFTYGVAFGLRFTF